MMKTFFTLIFGLFSLLIEAQELNTFSMELKGKTYTLSQDIEQSFLGIYTLNNSEPPQQFSLSANQDSGFEWGLIVDKTGELATVDVMEYAGGRMASYSAYTLMFINKNTGESGELMLYELNGKKYLGQAEKVESVAENK